jgi:hypothetical protein
MNSRQNRSSFPPHSSGPISPSRAPSSPGVSILPQDGFISDAILTAWVRGGLATRVGNAVAMRSGVDLILTDALRVLGRRDGESDPYGLTGRVLSLRSLIDRGATLHTNGIRIGASTYDIELGYSFQAFRADVA